MPLPETTSVPEPTGDKLLAIDAVLDEAAIFQVISTVAGPGADLVTVMRNVVAATSAQMAFERFVKYHHDRNTTCPAFAYVIPAERAKQVGMVGAARLTMSVQEFSDFEVEMHARRNTLAGDPALAQEPSLWFKFTA